MNDEIIRKNRFALLILLGGFFCFFLCFVTGQPILLLIFFICGIIHFFMYNSSRYCDYCGNYLQYVRQQIQITNNIACKTCDKKYRNGKIGINETSYKNHVKENGYGR